MPWTISPPIFIQDNRGSIFPTTIHIPNHNNFIPGRSTINSEVNPQALLDGARSGQYPVVGTGSRGQPIVNFGKPIGVDAASGLPTQFGTIHSSKTGSHIVPTNPTKF